MKTLQLKHHCYISLLSHASEKVCFTRLGDGWCGYSQGKTTSILLIIPTDILKLPPHHGCHFQQGIPGWGVDRTDIYLKKTSMGRVLLNTDPFLFGEACFSKLNARGKTNKQTKTHLKCGLQSNLCILQKLPQYTGCKFRKWSTAKH